MKSILITIIFASLFLQGCITLGDRFCVEEIAKEQISPNGDATASLMHRNCHATAPVTTHVNLRLSKKDFIRNEKTNEIEDGQILYVNEEYLNIEMVWINENKLKIVCHDCISASLIRKIPKWQGIEIFYEFPIDTKIEK